jgi:hypothetical protein
MSFLKNLFGDSQHVTLTSAKTVLDLVTSTAALASDSAQIDPMLDGVRAITAQIAPGQTLAAGDEAKLMRAYLQLEQYLITKEPLRSFTKEELRARIAPELLGRLTSYESKQ